MNIFFYGFCLVSRCFPWFPLVCLVTAAQPLDQLALITPKTETEGGSTEGRSILTAKMKKTRMCDFHKEGR